MKKQKLQVSFIILFIFLLIGDINAEDNNPNTMFMGFATGEVVKVSLNNWDVKYYQTKTSRYYLVSDIKYFDCCKKLIFVVVEPENHVGVIDVDSPQATYVDPAQCEGRPKMINVLSSSKEPNVIYFETSDNLNVFIDGDEGESSYGQYDIEKNICKKVPEPTKDEVTFFPDGKFPDEKDAEELSVTKLIQGQGIHIDGQKDKLLYVRKQYAVVTSNSKLYIIYINSSTSVTIIITSPDGFGAQDKRLLNPASVELALIN